MAWDYRKYGTAVDPIHKSHLNKLTGDWGCPKSFQYEMNARDAVRRGEVTDDELATVSGAAAAGTAAHETIARALQNPHVVDRLLSGSFGFSLSDVTKVYREEFEREVGGREIAWYSDKPDDVMRSRCEMITGLLNRLHTHVAAVELVEAGFITRLGPYWLCGHVDLVYRPRSDPSAIALADWKTGKTKPGDIELDHGWEAGVYSTAIHQGLFIPRDAIAGGSPGGQSPVWTAVCRGCIARHSSRYIAERNAMEAALGEIAVGAEQGLLPTFPDRLRSFAAFPSEIRHVHLADYVPYRKAGKKEAKRPEELAFYQLAAPAQVKYVAGDLRGPAWLPVRVTAYDMPRLESRLRNVVGMVRLGKFIDQVGEKCRRCPYRGECLTSGYQVRGDEAKALDATLRDLGDYDDGL